MLSFEQIVGLSLVITAGWLAWRDLMARKAAARFASPPPRDLKALLHLDHPHSRAGTLQFGRDLLETHLHNEDVGLVVISVEPDGCVESSMAMDVDDVLVSVSHLLDTVRQNRPDSAAHVRRCAEALAPIMRAERARRQ